MRIAVFYVAFCWLTFGGSKASGQATLSWKTGDSWHISVELILKEPPEKPKISGTEKEKTPIIHQYDMHIVILGTEKVDGANCWKVDFLIAEKKPPAGLTGRYRVCVDAEDGWPRKAFSFRDYRNLPIDQFDKARCLTTVPVGYPMEIFPAAELRDAKGAKSSYTLKVTSSPETGVRTAILRTGDDNELEIRQKWKEGEKWWHEYERYRKGNLDLRAHVVPKVVV